MTDEKSKGGRPVSQEKLEPFMIRLPASAVRQVRGVAEREATPLATVMRRLLMERLGQLQREDKQ